MLDSDDLVERLRDREARREFDDWGIMDEAADAIEALTAERDAADALIAATFADAAENNIRLAELSHRAAELEAAIDSIEAENGITSNGNMWRFWSKQAQELATKVDAERARAGDLRLLMAAQGQIADAQAALHECMDEIARDARTKGKDNDHN